MDRDLTPNPPYTQRHTFLDQYIYFTVKIHQIFCRCQVVINFFDNAHRVSVSEDLCDDCGAHIVDVDFSKVRLYTY